MQNDAQFTRNIVSIPNFYLFDDFAKNATQSIESLDMVCFVYISLLCYILTFVLDTLQVPPIGCFE